MDHGLLLTHPPIPFFLAKTGRRQQHQHQQAHPRGQESTPIADTAPTHWHQPREAAPGRVFTPIGHIALDLRPSQDRQLGLISDGEDEDGSGIAWVANLYISWALQRHGLGREVMGLAEDFAANGPLRARWLVLDTSKYYREQQANIPGFSLNSCLGRLGAYVMADPTHPSSRKQAQDRHVPRRCVPLPPLPSSCARRAEERKRLTLYAQVAREQQMEPALVRRVYLAQGNPAPVVPIQDWYEAQGYEAFAQEVGGYKWVNPETGERQDIDYVFLRKRLK